VLNRAGRWALTPLLAALAALWWLATRNLD
jgi:hypothetical protein